MPAQKDIPLAANVLGTIGTVFWCVQLVPQIWHNWRHKKTEGLPRLMMLLWAISAVAFGAYAVVQNFNIPIQVQPQAWGTLSLITWAQILIYSHKWPTSKATTTALGLFLLFGGIEVLLVLTLKGPYNRGIEWPMVLIGSLAALFLALGILPPYPEIWKRRGRVVGINFVFLGMDALGAVFSLLAIVAQRTFDILGGVIYIVVLILEAGIFLSHFLWLYRTRLLRKQAQIAHIDFDDLPEARRYQVRRRSATAMTTVAAGVAEEEEEGQGEGQGERERGRGPELKPNEETKPKDCKLGIEGSSGTGTGTGMGTQMRTEGEEKAEIDTRSETETETETRTRAETEVRAKTRSLEEC